jgi:pimeloyl-ACP methyl ester carboxylesterase
MAILLSGVPQSPSAQEIGELRSGFAEVAEGQLYYEVSGRGEPLVLIHGNAGDRRHWDHQFAALATDYHIIRYDVRGFGQSSLPSAGQPYSDYEDLRRLLDYLDVPRAHIAGWSMGSGIAIDFVLAYPERSLSLISVGPWVNGYSSPRAESMFADFGLVVSALQENGASAGAAAWMATPFFAETIRDQAAGQEFYEIAQDYSWWALMNASPLQTLEPPAVSRLEQISVPTLILTAEHDIPACLEVAELLERSVPGSDKVVLNGTGHLLHIEKSAEFNARLRSFLDGTTD